MNKLLYVILVISIIGNIIGLFIAYKFWNLKGYFSEAERQIANNRRMMTNLYKEVDNLTGELDNTIDNRMVFLHHSVGKGLLNDGGLRDRLLEMGIIVKSATYGDSIGEDTDMNHWAAKFGKRMEEVFGFRNHPNQYYQNGESNDIVVFKSCFPNSDIVGEGTAPGDPNAPEKTIANYKATFEALKEDFRKYPDKLFIYMTAPPQSPDVANPQNAARAREFNDWLLKEYYPQINETGIKNFFVFDLFGVLADQNNVLKKEYRLPIPGDSHPNNAGSTAAVDAFIQFFRPVWMQWQEKHGKS
jgi:hypothetical protein